MNMCSRAGSAFGLLAIFPRDFQYFDEMTAEFGCFLDPPLHRAAERAALLEQVLAVCAQLAGPLTCAPPPPWLAGALRAQLSDTAAALLRAHFPSLRQRPDDAMRLLAIVRSGLCRPEETEAFRCSLRALRQLHERALTARADPPPWACAGAAELGAIVLAVRLEPAHAALHEELGEILFAAAAAHDDVAAAAAQQLRDHLAAAVTGPPEAQKQALYAEFCASGPRDLPTYNLALARFAHDLACFRAACS